MSSIVNKIKDAVHGEKHQQSVPEGTYGPHSSRLANAADPRVDSDLDNSRNTGALRAGHGEYGQAYAINGGAGYGTGAASYGSNEAAYGNERQFVGSGATGMTGTGGKVPEGVHGPHSNRVMNALDPRVDSDRDGRAAIGTGPGPAPNTAGPHNSDMMNKMDPRVDSDLDGSKTLGGNRTYQ